MLNDTKAKLLFSYATSTFAKNLDKRIDVDEEWVGRSVESLMREITTRAFFGNRDLTIQQLRALVVDIGRLYSSVKDKRVLAARTLGGKPSPLIRAALSFLLSVPQVTFRIFFELAIFQYLTYLI